jgi:hypothetical protein
MLEFEIETPLKKLIRWERELTYMFDSDYRVAMALLEKIRSEGTVMLMEEDKLIETYKHQNTNQNDEKTK